MELLSQLKRSKFTDPLRQEDNLFGGKRLKKMERSLHSILSEKAQNPIKETETYKKEDRISVVPL